MSNKYKVNLEDKFTLDYLLIKHFQLWQDINAHRKMYVGTLRDRNWLMMSSFNEEKEKEVRKKHIEDQLNNISPEDRRELVKETLVSIFPELSNVLEDRPRSSQDYISWQRDRKVAHPDVLDTYFGSSTRDEIYSSENKSINELLSNAKRLSDDNLIKNFKSINKRGLDSKDEESNLIILTREYLLRTYDGTDLFRILKVWLFTYLNEVDYLVREDNSVLVRILSAINSALDSIAERKEKDEYLDYIFMDVEKNIKHPSSALRMLLYIHPDRNNHFFSIKDYSNIFVVSSKVLKFVDSYYIGKNINPFTEGTGIKEGDWRFIIYQWALSISNNGKVNLKIRGSATRFKRVNEFIFKYLNANDRQAFIVINREFWGEDIYAIKRSEKWIIGGNIDPFEKTKLTRLVRKLCLSKDLNKTQRDKMKDLSKSLKEYLKSQNS